MAGTYRGKKRSKSSRTSFGFTMSPGPRQLAAELEGLRKEMVDLRPVWPKVARHIRASIAEALQSKGSSIGAKWPPYKPSYAKRVGSSTPTLNRSGRLFAAATSTRASKLMKPLSFVYRIRAPHVRVHEFGSKQVAKRSFAQVSARAEQRAGQDIGRHIDTEIKQFEAGRASRVLGVM